MKREELPNECRDCDGWGCSYCPYFEIVSKNEEETEE